MPRTPREVVRSALPPRPGLPKRPVLPALPSLPALPALGALPLPGRARHDLLGWTTTEVTAYRQAGRGSLRPPRRAGHEAVRLANAMASTLPVDALILARAVADAAPPVGHEISPTLQQIVDRYLPDTLVAYRNSGRAAGSPGGHRLIIEQLHLLHQVTRDVVRAQAEHDDRELRVQEAFLKDRFARTTNTLDLSPAASTRPWTSGPQDAPDRPTVRTGPRSLAASTASTHHRLDVERCPTAVLTLGTETVHARLALPPGVSVVLGAVVEKHSGAVEFINMSSRRWQAKRRQRGFGTAQLDVAIDLPVAQVRRFILHATTRATSAPIEVVLFLGEGSADAAELPTTLHRLRGTRTTVLASGHDTSDGLFIRNESLVFPDLRSACEAFDHGRVTWLSSDTPAV